MSEQSFLTQAVNKSLIFALMLIPTAISIFIAIQIKNTDEVEPFRGGKTPQIVCFSPDVCAIQVQNNWYRINGIIKMDEVVPEEYRLQELVDEANNPDPIAEPIDN